MILLYINKILIKLLCLQSHENDEFRQLENGLAQNKH